MGMPKQTDLARDLGVTKGRVSQLKKQGMPMDSVAAAKSWYVENVDQRLSPKLIPGIQLPPKEQMAAIVENAYDIQQARAKREFHEANLAELKERQALGELVDADRVRRVVTTWAATARAGFERIPDKLAERLAVMTAPNECHALIALEIDQVLADLAAGAAAMKLETPTDGRT
jgi:phage terminase Nu1 subunit (DNA packaging protein)